MRFASSAKVYPHADGTLQTFINHPVAFLHLLPDGCTYEQASLVEPLSVVLHAARRAHITAGQSVLVFGAGAVGLLGIPLVQRLFLLDTDQHPVCERLHRCWCFWRNVSSSCRYQRRQSSVRGQRRFRYQRTRPSCRKQSRKHCGEALKIEGDCYRNLAKVYVRKRRV